MGLREGNLVLSFEYLIDSLDAVVDNQQLSSQRTGASVAPDFGPIVSGWTILDNLDSRHQALPALHSPLGRGKVGTLWNAWNGFGTVFVPKSEKRIAGDRSNLERGRSRRGVIADLASFREEPNRRRAVRPLAYPRPAFRLKPSRRGRREAKAYPQVVL